MCVCTIPTAGGYGVGREGGPFAALRQCCVAFLPSPFSLHGMRIGERETRESRRPKLVVEEEEAPSPWHQQQHREREREASYVMAKPLESRLCGGLRTEAARPPFLLSRAGPASASSSAQKRETTEDALLLLPVVVVVVSVVGEGVTVSEVEARGERRRRSRDPPLALHTHAHSAAVGFCQNRTGLNY